MILKTTYPASTSIYTIFLSGEFHKDHAGCMIMYMAKVYFGRERKSKSSSTLVFEGPVTRLEKDRDWTGLRPQKTRK